MTLKNSDFMVDKPYVDPHWKADDPRVFNEIADRLIEPASLENRFEEFINMNIEVALAVHKTRLNQNFRNQSVEWEDLLKEYPDWFKPTGIKPIFNRAIDAAKYVIDDIPDNVGRNAAQWLADKGVKPIIWMPHEDGSKNFHHGIITRARLHSELTGLVNPTCFYLKWKWQVPRPQAVIQGILNEKIDCPAIYKQVLEDIVDQKAVLEDKRNFTVFYGTSPTHPSFVQMHGTNSIAQYFAIIATWQIEPGSDEDKAVLNSALLNLMSRELLGVHTYQDHMGSIALAQEIAMQEIPRLLSEWNGADPKEVRERLEKFRIDTSAYLK